MTTWWAKFLGWADKIPMAYKGGLDYNLDNLTKYVFDQAGSSIRTWLEIMDYDMDKFARSMVLSYILRRIRLDGAPKIIDLSLVPILTR